MGKLGISFYHKNEKLLKSVTYLTDGWKSRENVFYLFENAVLVHKQKK